MSGSAHAFVFVTGLTLTVDQKQPKVVVHIMRHESIMRDFLSLQDRNNPVA